MQQENIAENMVVTYYKCIIDDLVEANEHLKAEVEEIERQMCNESSERRRVQEEKDNLEKDFKDVQFDHKRDLLKMKTQIMYLNSKLAKDTKRLNDQLDQERKVFH